MIPWPIRLAPARDRAFDVLAVGENSLDFVGVGPRPSPGTDKTSLSSFAQYVGGQAATAAVGCARQAWRTRYVGSFGDDAAAALVQQALTAEGLDVVAVTRSGAGSRVAMILVDETNGDRSVFEYRDPRLAMGDGDIPPDAAVSARVLMLDATHPDAAIALAEAGRAAGVPVVIDIDRRVAGAARLLSLVDVLVVPERFALEWTGVADARAAMTALVREFNAPATILTLGPEGSIAMIGGVDIRTPPFTVVPVDTTGAGDAFRAGLVSGWLGQGERPDAEIILAHANATASLNCAVLGAQAGLPGREDVEALVTRRWLAQSK